MSNIWWQQNAPYVAIAALFAIACALGGCASGGAASNALAAANSPNGPTIAFESIDGPPPPVFERMVSVLDSESKLRSLSIVSRENAAAAYRVRGYLAAEVHHGRTTIAWVWDVYDQNQQRALRLSGEEPAGKAGRDAWTAADDLVLRKIAQAGMSGLTNLISGAIAPDVPQPPPPATPSKRGPAIADASLSTSLAGEGALSALAYTDH